MDTNKIKMIRTYSYLNLEEEINNFIADKFVCDIRYTHCVDRNCDHHYSAMIWYLDRKEEENGCPRPE